MAKRMVALALLVMCLGASALIAEAARSHEKFAASTYYESDETVIDIVPKDEPATTKFDPNNRYPKGYPRAKHVWNPTTEKYETADETDAEPQGRYPNGYPGAKHVWNPKTEKYDDVETNETVANPAERYPHGYYGKATYDYKEGDTLTTVKSTGNYTKVDGTQNRYPHGYYGKATYDYKEGDTLTVVKSTGNYTGAAKSSDTNVVGTTQNRYPHGYYGKATYDYKEGDTLTVVKSSGDNTAKSNVDSTQNRYPNGYYGKATYDYKEGDTLTTVKSQGNYTEESSLQNRYPKGYYGQATYDYKEGDTLTVTKSQGHYTEQGSVSGTQNRYPAGYNNGHSSYSSVTQPAAETFDPLNRYPNGYYGKARSFSAQATSQKTSTTTNGRYPNGYYPDSEYSKQTITPSKPGATSYAGNINTLPYPSSGVPFVASGGGCRTAYWAENTNAWPSFLTVTSTVGDAFGSKATEVYGQTTILKALLKYGSDPYSDLLRAGLTALLNSYTRGAFAISHIKVIEEFNAALVSKDAAKAQAVVFETKNVESISAGNACT